MADERPDGRDGRDRRDDGDGGNSTPADEPRERLLRERAPLLRRRREVGAPDAAFVARLRANPLARALRGEVVTGAELLYRVPVKQ